MMVLQTVIFATISTSLIICHQGLTVAEDALNSDSAWITYNYELHDQPDIKGKKNIETQTNYSKSIKFAGGCLSHPNIHKLNGKLSCSSEGRCRASCAKGYRFPHGEKDIILACHEKKWKIQGHDYNSISHCEPICLPECRNNGICIAPNRCNCTESFSGAQCQFETKPCLNFPPLIANAERKCNSKTCTITCIDHFAFPDGSSVANLLCKHGNWKPTRSDWVTIPDCQPACNPQCQNRGICLSLNVCQCPKDYRGPQCQYRVDACSAERLAFNGGFQCNSMDEDSYVCSLNCPTEAPFEFPPSASYVCRYEFGRFEPQPVPQCRLPAGGRLVAVGNLEEASHYRSRNFSWSMESSIYESYENASSVDLEYTSGHGVRGEVIMHAGQGFSATERLEKKVEAGSCFAWSGTHYKTFDGQIYSFESRCAYTLLKDTRDGFFTVSAQNDRSCDIAASGHCPRVICIYIQGKEYILSVNADGLPELRSLKKRLPIPSQTAHLRVEMDTGGQFVVASLDAVGLRVRWDGAALVQVEASESLWNRTAGLCGSLNGDRRDDIEMGFKSPAQMANSWKIDDIGESCEEYSSHQDPCTTKPNLEREAREFCSKLLSDARYNNCANFIHLSGFESACRLDYCSCRGDDRRKCTCDTMGVYVRQCAHKGIVSLSDWRDNNVCPMMCSNGKVYMSCGPRFQVSCGSDHLDRDFEDHSQGNHANDESCEEGCFCPSGTVLNEGRCISPPECPCKLRGKSFAPGSSISKDCNTCSCENGKWRCSEVKCSARCSVIGDPHYTTFDGKRYDFMGQCSYYLVKGDNYSVEAENAACSNAISEMMGFIRTYQDGEPSCTRTVTIRLNVVAIKLKQNHQILVNGEDVTKLPMLAGGARVRIISSIFISVKLPNDLEILWDGISRVYVNAPSNLRGKTKGFCGTFSSNQKDDFLTPDGDVEQAVVPFANKWKTEEQCPNVQKDPNHPCEANLQKQTAAEKYCSVLKKNLFFDCHWYADPEPFYKDCMYDMCACESNVEACLCPTLAAYAKECAHLGVVIAWRQEVQECRVRCPGDQEYQVCGSSCARSCADISFQDNCKEECVEGCNCPPGFTLNINSECVTVGQCPCIYGEIEFLAGYREIRPGPKGQELCTCAGGKWSCNLASSADIHNYPAVAHLKNLCSASRHQELTNCEPVEPSTCRNMHRAVNQSPAICRPGCICKAGYVLDIPSNECVREKECPCYHGGHSYKEGEIMQEECNTCHCSAGKWNCTDIVCPGVCSVWGDSHYKTFDDRHYDFQGICDYVLAKGRLSDDESFDITIRNVACGTTGVTCSKSITLTVGKTRHADLESITMTRGKSLTAENFSMVGRITMRRAGLFIFLDVPDLGLVVQWDEGTRVHVRLNPKWKGLTKGLCGDFNDDAEDDFKTPSGGVPEATANLFGDSWKMSEFCGRPEAIQPDTCAKHPERRLWATQRCHIMKSELFGSCHSEVAPHGYIERCIYDACGCDEGGDCECLCTAIAAYAQECNARGVPVQWRSQRFCPMQCNEGCSSYSACISTCPRETCENLVIHGNSLHLCDQDICVEGCLPKPCPKDHVYLNLSYDECVPRADCKVLCKVIDGVQFFEGDKIRGDECHSCTCSRGKAVCSGEPCGSTTIMPLDITTPNYPPNAILVGEQRKDCKSGWTMWFNRDVPKEDLLRDDIENLPTSIEMLSIEGSAVCEKEKMKDIQCRTADSKIFYKDVDLNVDCNLDEGLICLQSHNFNHTCPDFEISVLCECDDPITPITSTKDSCKLDELYRATPNCQEYLQCTTVLETNKWITKTCGPGTVFNQKLQICDWPQNVVVTKPECLNNPNTSKVTITETTTLNVNNTQEKYIGKKDMCKEDEIWSDCAIQCSRTCEYFNYILTQEGKCSKTVDCASGCIPASKADCPINTFWRDWYTCTDKLDCMCKSDIGEPVAPGAITKVSDCKTCQCINNFYTCYESGCNVNDVTEHNFLHSSQTQKEELTVIIVPNTVSPPQECDSENYTWLIEKSPFDVIFNISSQGSPFITSESARLRPTDTMIVWRPILDNDLQWIEVKFDKPKPIYGVIIRGDSFEDKYVTSYKVLFSEDGHVFSYVTESGDRNVPKILRGSIDSSKPVRQIFQIPIEAKIIRINPVTWHKGIAMQVELVGCGEAQPLSTTALPIISTSIITETIIKPVCTDSMGYLEGIMSDLQVSVSSSFLPNISPDLRLSSLQIWRPLLDNPDQYIQFDFLEPRNITGIETKGGNGIWTSAYKVSYSADGKMWNPIFEISGVKKEFLGNVDDYHSKINYFTRPISATLLRIYPTRWHGHIGMKVEIRGCFLAYPTIIKPDSISTPRPDFNCNICNGIKIHNGNKCKCEGSLWWDGQACVDQQHCPCVDDHITYSPGSSYETADCHQCLCMLGGNPICQRKMCPQCPIEHQAILTELCVCLCKPCPVGQRLCPTSNVCILEKDWCNNVQDCPDDEVGCQADIEAIFNQTHNSQITKQTTINVECQTECPPGFIQDAENIKAFPSSTNVPAKYGFTVHTSETIKTSYSKVLKIKMPTPTPSFTSRMGGSDIEDQLCPKLICKSKITSNTAIENQCPKVACPQGFQPKLDQLNSYRKAKLCDNTCVPVPPKERICNVIGRTFTTFDSLEYKYDICNHILARDRDANRWYIVAEKVCKDKYLSCQLTLIVTFDGHEVILHPDMYAVIDGSYYSPSEVKRLADKNPLMKLSRVGNALRIESKRYPFWAVIDSIDSIKIGASEELAGHADGMCGYLDGLYKNDLQTPQGELTKSTQEFGDSWKVLESAECESQICPRETREEAWKMCNLVKDTSFEVCATAVDSEKFVSSCLETSCACLNRGNSTSQECRCQVLTSFVSQCLASNKTVELPSWRSIHNCPAICDAPFVHKDCFRHKCEMSCGRLQELSDPCPVMEGLCVPGCFCPDGMVRNGDRCIPPPECRDCACDGFGDSKYVTFDKSNIVFNGNCTYVLSKNTFNTVEGRNEQQTYEVLITNGECLETICTKKITILYQGHKIELKRSDSPNELSCFVDDQKIQSLPYKSSWLFLEKTPNRDVKLLISTLQLELIIFKNDFAFTLRTPSHTFGGTMEGLCGDCNGRPENDLKKPDGELTSDMQEFGISWVLSSDREDEQCSTSTQKQPLCVNETASERVCSQLLETEVFARCHGLIDPLAYYMACKDTLCNGGSICGTFEVYARICSIAGICVDWRSRDLCPYQCPPHLEYHPCKPGCPESCESLELQKPCLASPIEGCFCPPDHVMVNDRCIPKRSCFICDSEGHVDGDIWQPNKCTQCSCQNRIVNCQEMNCPALETVCEQSSTPVVVRGTENDCCPKYLCIPHVTVAAPSCIDTQQPVCGFAQTLKVTVDGNGCQQFICQCITQEECVSLEDGITQVVDEILEPGFVKVTNTSGCCPRTTKVCNPEICPQAQNCPKYHNSVVKQNPESCCPTIECEPPKDLCLYYMDASNDLSFMENLIVKKVDETWFDGKCKICTCEFKNGNPTPKCATKECLSTSQHPDNYDYVVEEILLENQCCPDFKRVACKHDGVIYQAGDKWHPNPSDICLTAECSMETNGIIKKILTQDCPQTCQLGYDYRASQNKRVTCCGECMPVACVVGDQLKYVDDIWYSNDFCVSSTCVLTNGTLHIKAVKETCKPMDLIDETNYQIKKEKIYGKCCPNIIVTACISDGNYYKPGETWRSSSDTCLLESCQTTASGKVLKQKETQVCNKDCSKGWEYQLPESGACCGKCKQIYCIVDELLYEPSQTWYSEDNCTIFSCTQKDDQLLVSTSSTVCPELNCAPELIYNDGCCNKCPITKENIIEQLCTAEIMETEETIGILSEKKGNHGFCKNFKPIEGLTECRGHCDSATHFDTISWEQVTDCKCCKPAEYGKISVELKCEDGKIFRKTLNTPKMCSCENCSATKEESNQLLKWYKTLTSKNE